ncbi:hypothetical protein [uncultured Rhodospira sp.]|uniref:hypothetical protein n=1 Tax=uncultured Rhodospira sp. TaxID=1936189 RepID=UPI002608BECA|nr:hypothetical protein [uncultured Rhodospira sp.]
MAGPSFDHCVFINAPFDDAYAPLLRAILFCVTYLGYVPRLATERSDSGEMRLAKILGLIETSRFSIHDLSRCQAASVGEHYRLNMPFELGLDYGCRLYCGNGRGMKRFLILEEQKYRYQAAISDLAGCDIQAHQGQYGVAVRKVRNWLVSEAGTTAPGAERILGAYEDFQEWHWKQQMALGFSEDDIRDAPVRELLEAMCQWMDLGQPT